MPKVSVIIPVYGVAKYVERCARSLFEQTLEDMEFIFVDDCTKDSSISILEDVAKQYPDRKDQVLIIHHEHNRGVSRARETGVRYAKGDYIAHCDSDDWVERDMYQAMYDKAIEDNLNFVKCHYCNTDGNFRAVQEVFREGDKIVPNEDAIRYLLSDRHWDSIWNTLVRRTIYTDNDIRFTDHAMLEDFLLSVQLLFHASRIGVLDAVYYNYFCNPESICRLNDEEIQLKRSRQAWKNSKAVISFVNSHFGEEVFFKETMTLKYVVRRMLIPALRNPSNYATWDIIYGELGFAPCMMGNIGLKDRAQYFIAQTGLYPVYASIFKR